MKKGIQAGDAYAKIEERNRDYLDSLPPLHIIVFLYCSGAKHVDGSTHDSHSNSPTGTLCQRPLVYNIVSTIVCDCTKTHVKCLVIETCRSGMAIHLRHLCSKNNRCQRDRLTPDCLGIRPGKLSRSLLWCRQGDADEDSCQRH